MSEQLHKGLLPAGLADVLAPQAAHEYRVVGQLLQNFQAQGYLQIKPPMLEFEEGLLSGTGAAVAGQTFRLMDPISQRMMGLRADITPQVVRIATTRLGEEPRPLRLCYSGQVLQVRGSQLRPQRQFSQVGAELIGAPVAQADAEVALLAAGALTALGIQDLSLDINVPTLVGGLARDLGLSAEGTGQLRAALDRKDAALVADLAGAHATLFLALLRAAGPAEHALGALRALDLTPSARGDLARLEEVVGLIRKAAPDLELTVDPVEHRGFEYQTGISFIIFAKSVRGELGRGGRYDSVVANGGREGESSTGFSLFMDTVLPAVPVAPMPEKLYVPFENGGTAGQKFRSEGWITVAGLAPEPDPVAEARRLGCSHFLEQGAVKPVPGDSGQK